MSVALTCGDFGTVRPTVDMALRTTVCGGRLQVYSSTDCGNYITWDEAGLAHPSWGPCGSGTPGMECKCGGAGSPCLGCTSPKSHACLAGSQEAQQSHRQTLAPLVIPSGGSPLPRSLCKACAPHAHIPV